MWFTVKALDVVSEIENGSDRTIGVVAGAVVDSYLTDALKRKLVPRRRNPETRLKVQTDIFSPEGALGAFGAKIQLAYLLGYFTDDAYADMQAFKYIRNLFAHYAEHNSFEASKVKDRCANFRLLKSHVSETGSYTIRKSGKVRLETVGVASNKLSLSLIDREKALKGPKERFITTAKLFIAALELHRQRQLKPPIL
jgi:hypothetical protein